MAHFAEIDNDNIVVRVVVVPDEQEHRGQEFMADDLGLGGTWVQTSYNTRAGVHQLSDTPLHKNYAGIGYVWDGTGFSEPQPHGSWSLDENYIWQPPTPRPDDGERYLWDEDTTSWVKPDSPYPSWVWSDEHGMWQPPVPYPGVLTEDGPQAPFYEWDEDTTSWVEIEE